MQQLPIHQTTLLRIKYEKGNSDIMEIEDRKQTLLSEIQDLEGTIEVSRNVINTMDRVLEQRRNEVKSLECKKEKLQKTILWIMGFKEYKKIKDIARQHVETTLKDKRALLLVTMVAIIEAFKHDPEKQVLLSKVPNDGGYQPYYLQHQKEELLQLAEEIHSELANDLMNATMNSTFDKQVVDSFS